ncbi:hypothetical protein Bbelb_430390 [Branchiostoma belcheri]|nr:hypothetical protein Bbelb_430390 [Branchiostoma belcheri]
MSHAGRARRKKKPQSDVRITIVRRCFCGAVHLTQLFEFAGRLVGGSPSARCDWRARTPRDQSAPGSLPAPPPLLATCGFYGDAAWERPAQHWGSACPFS